MLNKKVRKFLFFPENSVLKLQTRLCFFLALLVAVAFPLWELRTIFFDDYAVQDDARQHVFWMYRFLDAGFFPNDLIADYFQSIAPVGYSGIYHAWAGLGYDPILLNKLLPILLSVITTGFFFQLSMQFLPIPLSAFISSFILQLGIWGQDNLISGTARAFFYPLFVAFLYYLSQKKVLPLLVSIVIQSLFYPVTVLISSSLLAIVPLQFKRFSISLSKERKDYWIWLSGLVISVIVLLPYVISPSDYGSTVTLSAARNMPEFLDNGRTEFFSDSSFTYWITGMRTGLLRGVWHTYFRHLVRPVGLLFPLLAILFPALVLWLPNRAFVRKIDSRVWLILKLLLCSLVLYFLAHAVLFKLYLPSRYTLFTFPILIALAAGISVSIIVEVVLELSSKSEPAFVRVFGAALSCFLIMTILLYPGYLRLKGVSVFKSGYIFGEAHSVYEFFAEQPKDILIASLSVEADSIVVFSQRSVLVTREHSLPYHTGYYEEMQSRARNLITAQYSPDASVVERFNNKYGVDFWLIEEQMFAPEFLQNHHWLQQFQPATDQAIAQLGQTPKSAIQESWERCTVLQQAQWRILAANCLNQQP